MDEQDHWRPTGRRLLVAREFMNFKILSLLVICEFSMSSIFLSSHPSSPLGGEDLGEGFPD